MAGVLPARIASGDWQWRASITAVTAGFMPTGGFAARDRTLRWRASAGGCEDR
jgi:hypothetical protein